MQHLLLKKKINFTCSKETDYTKKRGEGRKEGQTEKGKLIE